MLIPSTDDAPKIALKYTCPRKVSKYTKLIPFLKAGTKYIFVS